MTSPSICMAFFYLFLGLSKAAVTCGTDGVCRDTSKNGKGTGWKDKSYVGSVPVSITTARKRDVGCSDSNRCLNCAIGTGTARRWK
uniref:Secreted protein n=1 Tax=Globodera pallida TaxID=36090 RepID=A0A183C8M7_GLOPA